MKNCVLGTMVLATALLSGCTATEQGAGYGAGGGAAIGGALGGWQGAAIGAGAGALTGAVVGSAVDANEERRASAPPPPPPPRVVVAPAPPRGYPFGLRTNRPGLVKSPYDPNGPFVDVGGYAPGSLVRDGAGRIFVVP